VLSQRDNLGFNNKNSHMCARFKIKDQYKDQSAELLEKFKELDFVKIIQEGYNKAHDADYVCNVCITDDIFLSIGI
jgi:hypothetical protein